MQILPSSGSLLSANQQDQLFEQRSRLDLPLKNHGYLFSIVAGKAADMDVPKQPARTGSVTTYRTDHDTRPPIYQYMTPEQQAEYDRNQAALTQENIDE